MKHLRKTIADKKLLVEIMLSHPDPTFVAEGMFIVVEEELPNGETLLSRHLEDQDQSKVMLMKNSRVARICLLAWKIKLNRSLTREESIYLNKEKEYIQRVFDITKDEIEML